jgi:hypothetical protein
MITGKKLKVCPACNKEYYYLGNKDGYCEKHYYQLLRYGKLLDNSPRSIYDPNEYRTERRGLFKVILRLNLEIKDYVKVLIYF